jgi:hypothetical protein
VASFATGVQHSANKIILKNDGDVQQIPPRRGVPGLNLTLRTTIINVIGSA